MNKHAGHWLLLTLTTTSSHMNIHQAASMQITLLRLHISTLCVCARARVRTCVPADQKVRLRTQGVCGCVRYSEQTPRVSLSLEEYFYFMCEDGRASECLSSSRQRRQRWQWKASGWHVGRRVRLQAEQKVKPAELYMEGFFSLRPFFFFFYHLSKQPVATVALVGVTFLLRKILTHALFFCLQI